MVQSMRRVFALPDFHDEGKQYTASILYTILWALLAGAVLGFLVLYQQDDVDTMPVVGIFGAVVAASLLLVRLGHIRLPSIVIPLGALLMVTRVAFLGYGFHDTITITYFLVVVMAGLFMGKNAPIVFWFLSLLTIYYLYVAQMNGWLHSPQNVRIDDVIVYAIVMGVAAVMLRLLMGNLMDSLHRARSSEQNLRKLNEELEDRVEQRTRDLKLAKDQADEARKQAEEANQIKSQFLASMSHELRTPLNAILNFTEMMSLGMAGPVNEQQKDLLVKALESARHLLRLINDVLDVSKMQSGMMSLFIEDDVDLQEEVEQVAVTAETLIKDKPVKLVRDIADDLPTISADRRRIRQILLNLIANAVKFTDEGTITLSARRTGTDLLFAVADTGPGIPSDQQQIIFEPFVQTETGIKHSGGTGLGLPISRWLAEAHGGRLWVESTPGKGTTFYVTLPIRTASQKGS